MKKFIAFFVFAFSIVIAHAQTNPIAWTFTAKKKADKVYEVHMTAKIDAGWHLFSQTQPSDAIADPTAFSITANPLLTLDGKIKEVGKMEKFHDAKLGISANQYAKTIDFVQVVKLRANVKTNFSGSVEFQTCNDVKCLPSKTVKFDVALN